MSKSVSPEEILEDLVKYQITASMNCPPDWLHSALVNLIRYAAENNLPEKYKASPHPWDSGFNSAVDSSRISLMALAERIEKI